MIPTRVPLLAAGALALAYVVQTGCSAQRHSLTWDEPSFIGSGYAYLRQGDFRYNPSHPPLLQELAAAPLLAMDLRDAPRTFEAYDDLGNPAVIHGRDLVFEQGNDPVRIARWARLPALGFGTLIVLGVFFWGRRLFDERSALVGAALCATCPNLIAHGGLATEDVGCAALMFAATWCLWLARADGGRLAWVRCGVVTGLALAAKYTALLLAPAFMGIAVVDLLLTRDRAGLRRWATGLGVVALIAVAIVAIPFGFRNGWGIYARGVQAIYTDLEDPMYYLAGTYSRAPWWYYTLAAFAFKTAVPALALIIAGVVAVATGREHRANAAFVLVPAALVVVASCFDRANLGLRRILPALPFFYLAASAVMTARWWRCRPVSAWVVGACVAWTAFESLRIYPNHLSYFSAAVGGPVAGPELLADSNIDWGQDLPALAAWEREHPGVTPYLNYFGTAQPEPYGVRFEIFPAVDPSKPPEPGTYAVSVHSLLLFRKASKEYGPELDWLTKYRPIDRAGWSIYIYRFP